MLLEQVFGNGAVPWEVDDRQKGENVETQCGENLGCLKGAEKDIGNNANAKHRSYSLASSCDS